VTTYADAELRPVETVYLWDKRLPYGSVVLCAGWRGSGKGLLTWHLAAAVTNGTPLPGEAAGREPGDVIVIAAEDDGQEDGAWRARAAGCDLGRVHDLTRLEDGSRFELSAAATNAGNLGDLRAKIGQLTDEGRNPQLIIFDPLNALVMHGSIKTDQGARRVIQGLQDVAKDTGVCILVIHHFVKSGSIGGSQGLVDACRVVYTIKPDPDKPDLKVLGLEKANVLGKTGDLRYRIIEDGHDSRIDWADTAAVEEQRSRWRERLAARKHTDPGLDEVQALLKRAQGGHALRLLQRAAGSRR
jgi:predicted ATP-dependent serine protease